MSVAVRGTGRSFLWTTRFPRVGGSWAAYAPEGTGEPAVTERATRGTIHDGQDGGPGDGRRLLTGSRLDVYQVRGRRFRTRAWRRGGLDPAEVHRFLQVTADEIDLLHRELAAGAAEIERLRVALHHWQTWHRHCGTPDLQWPISYDLGDQP